MERPPPVALADVPPRSETAFSEAQTLVRSSSNRSRTSIAKQPIGREEPEAAAAGPSSSNAEPALRSIFPTYNHNLPLNRQEYFPTQTSPTHIPRSAISRPLYSPNDNTDPRTPGPAIRSPVPTASPPLSSGTTGRWPPRSMEPPVIPPTSTTEELKGLWKVANGWRASGSEGRVYSLKMTADRDAPVYTLSSATQPFYNFRVDPTSASAYVRLSRHDPNKPFKGGSPTGDGPSGSGSGSGSSSNLSNSKAEGKHWQEALATTLEEESRRLPPNDGLVALLYPTAAARLALEHPGNATTVALAENECARLVWDTDTGSHFLVHPALAVPFCVTVERSPAWSRTEYTLEHLESPQHLGRLTRDGTGTGWLEVDTALAAKIDAVYLVDAAVAALLLVAHKDDRFARAEVFEPPPVLGSPSGSLASSSRRGKRGSRGALSWSSRAEEGRQEEANRKNKTGGKKAPKRGRMEALEIDVESQDSEKGADGKDSDKLPTVVRWFVKIVTALLKCLLWMLTVAFKALAAIVAGLVKCTGATPKS